MADIVQGFYNQLHLADRGSRYQLDDWVIAWWEQHQSTRQVEEDGVDYGVDDGYGLPHHFRDRVLSRTI